MEKALPDTIDFSRSTKEISIAEKSSMETMKTVGRKLVVVCTLINEFPYKSIYATSENSAPETEKTTLGNTLPSQPTKTMNPSFSSMSPSKIQMVIDKHFHCIMDPWDGSLPFTVFN